MRPAGALGHWVAVVLVTAYLTVGASWMLLRGHLPRRIVLLAVRSLFRRRHRGALTACRPERGFCFVADVPSRLPSDADLGSDLVLFENGAPLPHAHAAHDDIRLVGLGRYSHWTTSLYFATSDNSDPRHNGRHYTVEER